MVDRKTMVISLSVAVFVTAVLTSFIYTDRVLMQKELQTKQESKILKKVINMQGMTCEGCEEMISSTASAVPGVISVSASSPKQQAIVEYNTSLTDIDTIMSAIAETGYKTLSFEDFNESNVAEELNVDEADMDEPSEDGVMKCGAGKCGAN